MPTLAPSLHNVMYEWQPYFLGLGPCTYYHTVHGFLAIRSVCTFQPDLLPLPHLCHRADVKGHLQHHSCWTNGKTKMTALEMSNFLHFNESIALFALHLIRYPNALATHTGLKSLFS